MIRVAVLLLPLVIRIPAGSLEPLYAAAGSNRVRVVAFSMDRDHVTRQEFLAFVTVHPEWRRGAVSTARADAGYLHDWNSALDAGRGAELRQAVTNVSRLAAAAYCQASGKRLPTVNEWEYAAAASATKRDASADAAFRQHLISLYGTRAQRASLPSHATEVNAYGLRGLHGAVWEWTSDGDRHHGSPHDMSCAGASLNATDPSNYPAFMRAAVRASVTDQSTTNTLGFRCAS